MADDVERLKISLRAGIAFHRRKAEEFEQLLAIVEAPVAGEASTRPPDGAVVRSAELDADR